MPSAGNLLAFDKTGVAKLPPLKARAGKHMYVIKFQDTSETFYVVATCGPPTSFGPVQSESLGSPANVVCNRNPFNLIFEVSNLRALLLLLALWDLNFLESCQVFDKSNMSAIPFLKEMQDCQLNISIMGGDAISFIDSQGHSHNSVGFKELKIAKTRDGVALVNG